MMNKVDNSTKDELLFNSLLESEQKYQALFEHSNDAIFILQDFIFVDCNRKASELFQSDKEHLLNKKFEDFFPAVKNTKSPRTIWALEKIRLAYCGTPQTFDITIHRLDGSTFMANLVLNSFTFSGFTFLQAIVRDKTQEIENQKEFTKLSFALENSPVFIMMTDIDGKIEYINTHAVKHLGLSKSSLLGMSVRENCFGGLNPEDCSELWVTILSGNKWQGIFNLPNSQNEKIKMSATISPIKDDCGQIVNYIGIMEEIDK